MKDKYFFVLLVLFCLFTELTALDKREIIAPGLYGNELLEFVRDNYTPGYTLGYDNARDVLYGTIDLQEGNILEGIYSGYTIVLNPVADPSQNAYQQGINCEHAWPRSMGADGYPQEADMHHLYPCKINVNSARGNHPFAEISDIETDIWYYQEEISYEIPEANIDWYSEKDEDQPELFEPRESKKGDIARSMFYFFSIYHDPADESFWETQKAVLYEWHQDDPTDEAEEERNQMIASYQDDCSNPFVTDSTLAGRIWFYEDSDQIVLSIDYEDNQITLNWNNLLGAQYYKVESKTFLNEEWVLEAEVLEQTTWTDPNLDTAFKIYRVKAIFPDLNQNSGN